MPHPFDPAPLLEALRRTGLFDLDDAALDHLLEACEVRLFPPGEIVLREGEPGDGLYVILDGALQIFTTRPQGEVILARLPRGRAVGEQALLPDGDRRRTASARAAGPTALLRVPRAAFLARLAARPDLAGALRQTGRAQLLERLAEHGALARALTAQPDFEGAVCEVRCAAGEALITEGEPADALYLITAGEAQVSSAAGGPLARLGPGQSVGELGLARTRPRAATVQARTPLTALRVDGDWFRTRFGASPKLRAWIATLEAAYRLAGRGLVTHHGGRWLDRDTLTSVYHLADGREISVTQVVGEPVVDAQTAGARPDTTLTHERDGARRSLLLQGERLVGLEAIGAWPDLPAILGWLLDGEPLPAWDRAEFETLGTLPSARRPVEPLICRCLSLRHADLRAALRAGADNLEALQARTGCGRICGACLPEIEALRQGHGYAPAILEPLGDEDQDHRRYFLGVVDGQALPAAPGQHLSLRATIAGVQVRRDLLIAGWGDGGYEILIRRRPGGALSPWLFEQPPGITVELTPPSGLDLIADAGPCLCLVAGLGAPLAVAFARAAAEGRLPGPLIIHQSSRGAPLYAAELADRAAAGQLTLIRRDTLREGRLDAPALAQLAARWPDAYWRLCGPPGYGATLQAALTAAGVPPDRIHTLRFDPTTAPAPPGPHVSSGGWIETLSGVARGAWTALTGRR